MNIIIYTPATNPRILISRHLIDIGNYRLLYAEDEKEVVSLALDNEIQLTLLFDPPNIRSIIDLQNFLREKRRRMRVRILPSCDDSLREGWQKVINDALKPVPRAGSPAHRRHPRFRWRAGH
jgi:hypothetical protein